jgi:glycosyltransferase involved in cell wall biosynthesis
MTRSPRISVLLPARNAGRWLRHALGDLLAQRSVPLEIVAVDDHSTDRTGAILDDFAARDPRVRRVSTAGTGLGAALTAALAASRAPWVGIMEADDRCHPERFAVLIQALTEHPSWDGAVSRTTLLGEPGNGMRRYIAWQNSLGAPDELARERFIEIPALIQTGLYRRELIDRVGGFREPERWPLDIEFWMRAFASGARIGRVPRALYRWRQHPEQSTRTGASHTHAALQRCKAHHFVRGPAHERAVDLVSVGRTLDTWRVLLREEGASEVRALSWKPHRDLPPERRPGAVRLFVFGVEEVRRRARALTADWDEALDWFAA